MSVAELITELQKQPPNAEVFLTYRINTSGYSDDSDQYKKVVSEVFYVNILKAVHLS
jgi:hypothetical protein